MPLNFSNLAITADECVTLHLNRWALYPPGRVPIGVTVHVNEENGDVNIETPSSLQVLDEDHPYNASFTLFTRFITLHVVFFSFSGGWNFIHFLLMQTSR